MSRAWRHIAVVRPCCIGDAVFALPAIDALLRHAPQATLEVWTGHHSAPIHRLHGVADRISLMPDVAGVAGAAGLARRIVASEADLIVLLDRSRLLRTALQATCGRQRRLLCMTPDAAPQGHEIDRFLDVLEPLGVHSADATPHLPIPARTDDDADASRTVVIHVGGGGNPGAQMGSKQWPAASIAVAMELLHEAGWEPALLGGPDDVTRVAEIRAYASVVPAHIHVGDDAVEVSARRIATAAGYIGPDTGLTHVAAAFGVPTVAIFGPTNPSRYAPRGRAVRITAPPGAWQLQQGDLRDADVRAASSATTTASVEPSEVVSALLSMLPNGGAA